MDILDSTLHTLSGGGFTLPSGIILDFGGTSLPTGYLECDGSAVSRTTYASLFAAIGTSWGVGDGVTTFNLPPMARRTTVGRGGASTGTLGNVVGSLGGEEAHVQTVAEMASHTHTATLNDPGHVHSLGYGILMNGGLGNTGNRDVLSPTFITPVNTASSTTGATVTNNSNGSGNAANIMQPSAVVMRIIKT